MKFNLNQAVDLLGKRYEIEALSILGKETFEGEVIGFTMLKNNDFEFILDLQSGLEVHAESEIISMTICFP